jgi:hypothetical protein
MTAPWTRVSFSLPFLIPIDDSTYGVRVKGGLSRVTVRRVQKDELGLLKFEGRAAEIQHDTRGRLAFSEVMVDTVGRFQTTLRTDAYFDTSRDELLEKALEHLNRLIDVSRYVTGVFSLQRARYTDIGQYKVSWIVDGREVPVSMALLTTGGGPLVISSGPMKYLDDVQRKNLATLLAEEAQLDLAASYLMDAKSALLSEDYSLATVLSVIALEISLSKFTEKRGAEKGLKPKELQELLKDIGVRDTLVVLLKLLLKNNEQLPPPEILNECSAAITVRNNVVHRGLRNPVRQETQKGVQSIGTMIETLKSLMAGTLAKS